MKFEMNLYIKNSKSLTRKRPKEYIYIKEI